MEQFTVPQRCIAALIAGVVLHAMIFHPWLPYSVRERHIPGAWAMAITIFLAGLVLTFGQRERRGLVAASIVGGMWIGNVLLVAFDWMKDPTTHNLFPFEFIMIGFAIVPAAAGAFVSHLAARART
jgi:hypothetical protein